LAMGGLAVFLNKWQPKNIFILPENNMKVKEDKHSFGDIVKAWSPFYLLSIFVFLWSMPSFKSLFAEDGILASTTISFGITGSALSSSIDLVSATGTAILFAGLTKIATSTTFVFGIGVLFLLKTVHEY